MRPDDDTISCALRRADIALYHAKEIAGASYSFHTEDLDRDYRLRREMESSMREGIGNGGFRIEYQPIIGTTDLTPLAFAARLRWTHPDHGDIASDIFLPLAREAGLIALIDRWMLRQAIADASDWPDHAGLAVTLSAAELGKPGFADDLAAQLGAAGLDPARLILDIDADVLASGRHRRIRETIARLRTTGVKVSTGVLTGDEVGAAMAEQASVDIWRMDLARLRQANGNRLDLKIARILTDLAASLDLTVRFENVDTDEDFGFVRMFAGAHALGRRSGASVPADRITTVLAAFAHFSRPSHRHARPRLAATG